MEGSTNSKEKLAQNTLGRITQTLSRREPRIILAYIPLLHSRNQDTKFDGTEVQRQIDIYLAEEVSKQKFSIRPFGQQWYDGYSGDQKVHFVCKKFETQIDSKPRDVIAKFDITASRC